VAGVLGEHRREMAVGHVAMIVSGGGGGRGRNVAVEEHEGVLVLKRIGD
jgi:hypothetical protein